MPLILSRVSTEDMRQIVDLHYKVVQGPLSDILIGYDTEHCRRAAVERFTAETKHDPSAVWLKVSDTDTGRIVSTAHWQICSTWAPGPVSLDWLPAGEERALGEDIIHQLDDVRARHLNRSPHVFLVRLYTDPEYQRRGCGTMLVRAGCELADNLFLPAWVVSSAVGERLYRSWGFEEVGRPVIRNGMYDLSGPIMRRGPREPVVVNPRS